MKALIVDDDRVLADVKVGFKFDRMDRVFIFIRLLDLHITSHPECAGRDSNKGHVDGVGKRFRQDNSPVFCVRLG